MDALIEDLSLDEEAFELLSNNVDLPAFNYNYSSLPNFMLTTVDNPFNPFTDWDDWFAYDESKGYRTCSLVANLSRNSSCLSYEEQQKSNALVLDSILSMDCCGIYKLVVKPKR